MRRSLRRALLRGVTASVVLPMVIAVVVGTGALLSSLGDRAGAVGALRVAQAAAVAWVVAIVATAILGGLAALDDGPDRRHGGGAHWRRGGPFRGRAPWAGPWDERPGHRRRCGPRAGGRRHRERRDDVAGPSVGDSSGQGSV